MEAGLPAGHGGTGFPNRKGLVEGHMNMVRGILWAVQVAAGVVNGKGAAKYSGAHAFRHFYASWCINRKKDGGLELPIKTVQQRPGHVTILMTSDVYGHLFPRIDDGSELAEAEKLLMA